MERISGLGRAEQHSELGLVKRISELEHLEQPFGLGQIFARGQVGQFSGLGWMEQPSGLEHLKQTSVQGQLEWTFGLGQMKQISG